MLRLCWRVFAPRNASNCQPGGPGAEGGEAMANAFYGQHDEGETEADGAQVERGLHVQHGDLGRAADEAFGAQERVCEPFPLPLLHHARLHDSHDAATDGNVYSIS